MVNDIVVLGVIFKYLFCGMILEEGLDVVLLCWVVFLMKVVVDKVGVIIVIGDIKVVFKGKGDKIFINISGIGVILEGVDIFVVNCWLGDKIIVNGLIGDYGVVIFNVWGDFVLDVEFKIDCQVLNDLM